MKFRCRTLQVERKGRLLTETIYLQHELNAVDGIIHEEWSRAFTDVNLNAEAEVVIPTGAGRDFSPGGGMEWQQAMINSPRLELCPAKTVAVAKTKQDV